MYPCNAWFLGPTRIRSVNVILIDSAVFTGLKVMTKRATDRQTTRRQDLCTNGPHLAGDGICR